MTDQINSQHLDQDLKNKVLKKTTNTLPSGTAKKDYTKIIGHVFSATSQMSPEDLKSYVLGPENKSVEYQGPADEEGEVQNSNIYQKKGEDLQAAIPNPLENVRHQHLILQPDDQNVNERIEDDRINLCLALHTMNLKLGEVLDLSTKKAEKKE